MEVNSEKDNRKRKRWNSLFRFCVVHYVFTLIVFITSGLVFWGAVNHSMDMTNNEEFCISCHEMRDNVYQEYKTTVHYSNRTGVRATCPDCHVPREWAPMVLRKLSAFNEIYHTLAGSINTPEKFKAKRLQLAENVWRSMKSNDSHECRNCHTLASMELQKQKPASKYAHKRAIENNRTCIDCHMGIAHKIPDDYDKDGTLHEAYNKNKRPCADCHADMAQSDDW